MTHSKACSDLFDRFEGLRFVAYPDPGTGGRPWTLGRGHTFGIREGMTCTVEQADKWRDEDLANAAEIVSAWVKPALTQCQFDAVTDFVANVGPGLVGHRDGFVWLKAGGHSTMLNLLNAGAYRLAAAEFLKWKLPPLPGILARREAERELFLTGTQVQA